jgi:hypothetical protein
MQQGGALVALNNIRALYCAVLITFITLGCAVCEVTDDLNLTEFLSMKITHFG